MTLTNKISSIRRSILTTVLGFVFIFVSLALYYISSTFLNESKQQYEQSIIDLGKYIAQLSAEDIRNDRLNELNSKLDNFQALTSIHYIDIYKKYPDNFSIFASYNFKMGGSIANNTSRISPQEKEQFRTPNFEGDIVKYVAPIKHNDNEIGYIYIQSDIRSGLTFSTQLFIIFIVTFLVLFASVVFISFRLENIVTTPLRELNADVLHISQTKDYSYRVKSMPFKEIDILARNINNLLNRTERHITKLGVAEQQSLLLNIELEDKVSKRTEALKDSNQELLSTLEKLHQFQGQLVESEKMASLGDMVAGVAHEVNTPIGLGVTASTLLSDRLNEIKTSFDEKTLKSSQLKRFLNEGQENVGIIYRNLNRAAELISSFKKVAVDQSNEDFSQFNFDVLLKEVLLTLAPQIRKTPYQINITCPEDLLVVSKPGPINQVMINLILNSIIHGFDKRDYGAIDITVMKLGEQLNIIFKDDGHGIDASIKDKIFEPFTTTKRGEGGSGLGLHLVYNLVTQALGGSIRLDSEPDKGATFEINFPISEQLL
ncbi:HAMP domain-containing sensor histidine kinase [Colwellia sp. 1_MG-2023]|uniref:sensor histidine kinase n=1 Tax=Colwellia sp. 1_MG-2023 TaxID=3062649 RepID=UPI0026E37D63|nr:HAMP domain-containing sensor histidine kinase [Colwellia sp. 1_MG-2023]MDO6444812.1 HAMP domain-containing sensor histidine kinase [Colwellia sp. 1_MG-2023]